MEARESSMERNICAPNMSLLAEVATPMAMEIFFRAVVLLGPPSLKAPLGAQYL